MLFVSASMGAGHDAVARELARQCELAGHPAAVVDLLALLPAGLGPALRQLYGGMLRHAPWSYQLVYRLFFRPRQRRVPTVSPVTMLAAHRLADLVARLRPQAIVSTFHLAAVTTGQLRRQGRVQCPCLVVVTDFAAHQLWLHNGNDAFLTVHPDVAAEVAARTGRPTLAPGPVVAPAYRGLLPDRSAARRALGIGSAERVVLVAGGSWGAGRMDNAVATLAGSGRYRVVALCGRDEALRRRLAGTGHALALGWRQDMPALLAVADAVVENAGGSTAMEAFAAGVPVVSFEPIPGHGRDSATRMARAGVSTYARSGPQLLAALQELTAAGRRRTDTVAAGRALFRGDPAAELLSLIEAGRPAARVSPADGAGSGRP